MLEAGRVVAEGDQGREKVKEDVGVDRFYLFPDTVGYAVRSGT